MLSKLVRVQLFTTQQTITCRLLCHQDSLGKNIELSLPVLLRGFSQPMSLMSPVLAGVLFTTNAQLGSLICLLGCYKNILAEVCINTKSTR